MYKFVALFNGMGLYEGIASVGFQGVLFDADHVAVPFPYGWDGSYYGSIRVTDDVTLALGAVATEVAAVFEIDAADINVEIVGGNVSA